MANLKTIDVLNPSGKTAKDLGDAAKMLLGDGVAFDLEDVSATGADVGVVMFGVDDNGKARAVGVTQDNALVIGGELRLLLEEVVRQQKITNQYLLRVVGEGNRVDMSDLQENW